MNRLFITLFLIFPYILTANLIDDYNNLSQKSIDNIKKIVIIYKMGYPEKAKILLYENILKNNIKDYKKAISLLKGFDQKVINTLIYLDDPTKKEIDFDKDFIKQLNSKKELETDKTENKDENNKDENNKNDKIENKRLNPQMIDKAISISELLDNADRDKLAKKLNFFKNDKYLIFLDLSLKKKIEEDKIVLLNIPEGYHFLYNYYKNKDKNRAKKYKTIIEKRFPNYLKYNNL